MKYFMYRSTKWKKKYIVIAQDEKSGFYTVPKLADQLEKDNVFASIQEIEMVLNDGLEFMREIDDA